MYAFVSGKIEYKKELLVVSNGGIGYEIICSNNTLQNVGNVGDNAKLFTYLHVREDAFMLYGFYDLTEKQMFLDLISVSGIGPKMAIGILSGVSVKALLSAVANGDVHTLSSIKGVGKKTAERIVLELKGNLSELQLATMFSNSTGSASPSDEAIDALIAMGLPKLSAMQIVKDVANSGDSAEKIIAKALKNI